MQKTQRVKNVGTPERWLRIAGGAILAFVGLAYLLPGPPSAFLGALGVLFILLGADFVFTGVTGYCPLYNKLGWSTARRDSGSGRTGGRSRA